MILRVMERYNNVMSLFLSIMAGLRAICKDEQAPSATTKALVHAVDEIDIYTNSWGLQGEGKYIFSRDHLDDEAYLLGVTEVYFLFDIQLVTKECH